MSADEIFTSSALIYYLDDLQRVGIKYSETFIF